MSLSNGIKKSRLKAKNIIFIYFKSFYLFLPLTKKN